MSYTKTQWVNDQAPAINATNLNKIEQGIYDNDSAISTNTTNIGDLTTLTTTADTDLVSAINEVDSHADTNATNIGDLTTLTTTAKSNVVSAVNELDNLKATKDVATTSTAGLMSASDKTLLNNETTYSTTETRIGTWVDGKPLYRKVISKVFDNTIGPSTMPGIAYEQIDHGISNIRTCVKCTGVLVNTNGSTYTLPVMGYDPNINRPQFTSIHIFNSTTIGLRICNDTWSTNNTFYFECLYTKTTD